MQKTYGDGFMVELEEIERKCKVLGGEPRLLSGSILMPHVLDCVFDKATKVKIEASVKDRVLVKVSANGKTVEFNPDPLTLDVENARTEAGLSELNMLSPATIIVEKKVSNITFTRGIMFSNHLGITLRD